MFLEELKPSTWTLKFTSCWDHFKTVNTSYFCLTRLAIIYICTHVSTSNKTCLVCENWKRSPTCTLIVKQSKMNALFSWLWWMNLNININGHILIRCYNKFNGVKLFKCVSQELLNVREVQAIQVAFILGECWCHYIWSLYESFMSLYVLSGGRFCKILPWKCHPLKSCPLSLFCAYWGPSQ